MASPIWKDYYVDLGAPASAGAGVPFTVYCVPKSATIFSGRAYPKPGEAAAVVRINDLCADYIRHYFLEQEDPTMPAKVTFRVLVGSTVKGEVEFYNDWSYDPDYEPSRDGMNFPVLSVFAPGQYIPLSLYSGSPSAATVYMANGQVFHPVPAKSRGADFNNDYNDDFLTSLQYFGDSYLLPMADFPGAVRVVMAGRTYTLSQACPRYVLYYVNAYGGWDALPVEGHTVRTDNLTHHNAGRVYDNRLSTARGKVTIVNEIVRAFAFNTWPLTLQQSERMHHLLNSPSVYMHDLETGRVEPLTLTGTSNERKDTRGRLYEYTIEAELAQDRIRR